MNKLNDYEKGRFYEMNRICEVVKEHISVCKALNIEPSAYWVVDELSEEMEVFKEDHGC